MSVGLALAALVASGCLLFSGIPSPPIPIRNLVVFPQRTNYYVVKAYQGTNESDPSNEVAVSSTNNFSLSWSYDITTNIDGFRIYYGKSPGGEKFYKQVPPMLSTPWPPDPILPTNIVLYWPAGTADIFVSTNLSGPWTFLTEEIGNSVTLAIQPGPHFFSSTNQPLTIAPQ